MNNKRLVKSAKERALDFDAFHKNAITMADAYAILASQDTGEARERLLGYETTRREDAAFYASKKREWEIIAERQCDDEICDNAS